MKSKRGIAQYLIAGLGAGAMLLTASFAEAKTFKWAFQGDAQSLDPYSLNETFTLSLLGNVYEGLIRRSSSLEIQPGLAESWEILEPTKWRFHLRQGVKFQNGNDFNADDVLFSAERVRKDGSDLKTRLAGVTDIIKVDDYTVDFVTEAPNPILHYEWATWYIMDKEWAEANGAEAPTDVTGGTENYATRNANGTGPFMIQSRETDVKTVLVPHEGWWDAANKQHNLTEVIFTPIGSDATRVAALLSGEIDMMYPVPVQDMERIESDPNAEVLAGPELRTIFLGMDQERDELLYSNIKGKNPFKDARVREAFYRAIDVELIQKKVMRGLSTPSALMISPFLFTHSDEFTRLEPDAEMAKKLLADAGYPDGFEVTMDCPNNRYVNDEAICQAVVAMLARANVKVNLLAQPKAQYFAKILAPKRDTSFYLLGWTPGSFDSWNVMYNIIATPDESGRGKFNIGGYSNARFDELTDMVLSETDAEKRDAMIREAFTILHNERGYIPLHQQGLAWGKRANVSLEQRADNQFDMRYVSID
ncbi:MULTISPECIES: ABC transporter substrate-binding protein [Thalassobaculum]|uniref:Peptide/nickel transport system substrate-binding protein n=1 Tax=Thalassobaculum litoreum DSM 18839 TaxID=1123362 RepID=A0A8G2BF86_9PROT|nr:MULTISPECIES: ABC transporter substrate-binding protein [Thalassobaculum]SDF31384.1 peptide/nickel transport system substrate-binding protein [Thalassobaculum litoreum DSM 18839]